MSSEYIALITRIQQTFSDLERVVSRAQSLMDKAKRTNDDGYLDGVALNLHGFYAGVERMFEDIARSLGEALPTGPNWHQNLLLQMSAEFPSIRPPVVSQETRYCLDDYRGFRHVVRNVYTFNLRGPHVQELMADLPACYDALVHDLGDFVQFLAQLAGDEG